MFLRAVATAALLFAPLYAQAPAKPAAGAEALPDARTLIERHIDAIGGRKAVMSHKSMHGVGTLSLAKSGITAPLEVFGAAGPDRVLTKSVVPGIGEIIEGFDGTHAWSVSPMTGPMLKTGKELEQSKLDADFYSELRDPKKYPKIRTVEKTTFDGRPCYKVALTRVDGAEDLDFYDAQTGLRAGAITTRESPMGPITVTTVVSGYKKFGNMQLPTVMNQQMLGAETTISLTSVEYDTVQPSVFEPPAAIKALIK